VIAFVLLSFNFPSTAVSKTNEPNTINISQVRKVGKNDCAYKNLTKAYSSIGYQIGFTILPAKRALFESNAGRTDGETARVQYLEKRYPNLVRIPVAICHMHQNLLALKSNKKIESANLEDLTLGIINGGVFVEKEFTQYNPVRAISNKQLVDLLIKGRVDAISMSEATFKKLANSQQAPLVMPLARFTPTVPLFHYLHKKHHTLIPKITAALKQLEDSGFIANTIKNHQP
jgi:ABC-type amino acid transport substrate-binding protein